MSLLSNLNARIKSLAARIAQQFKTQQTAIDSKVSKSGDTMTGQLNVTAGFRIMAQDSTIEGGELSLDAANETLCKLRVDNYNNQFRVIYDASDGTVVGVFRVYSTGRLELPNNTAFWIA